MLVYNLYQTMLNTWCFYQFVREVWRAGMPFWGNRMVRGEAGFNLGMLIWIHYNNK